MLSIQCSPRSFRQLETEFIRFVLLQLFLSLSLSRSLSLSLSHAHCCNRICKNHSKARYNLLLFVHNTPIPPTYPRPQSHKVPCGWTNHTWNIISPSYSPVLWTALVLWCNGFNPCLVAPCSCIECMFAAGLGDNGDKLSQTSSCSSSTTDYVVIKICS